MFTDLPKYNQFGRSILIKRKYYNKVVVNTWSLNYGFLSFNQLRDSTLFIKIVKVRINIKIRSTYYQN